MIVMRSRRIHPHFRGQATHWNWCGYTLRRWDEGWIITGNTYISACKHDSNGIATTTSHFRGLAEISLVCSCCWNTVNGPSFGITLLSYIQGKLWHTYHYLYSRLVVTIFWLNSHPDDGEYSHRIAGPRKRAGSPWNLVAIMHTSWAICYCRYTSGHWRPSSIFQVALASKSIYSSSIVLLDLKMV